MISIVVLAFSGIALIVFSEGGIENSPPMPRTNLQENINTNDDTIQIFHIGGEAIDLSAIKVILLFADGQRKEFSKSDFKDPDGTETDDDVFMFGDCIVINDENIRSNVDIDMSVVYTPSEQVIQKTVLRRVFWERPEWISPYPYGSICDKSGRNNETFLSTELVGWINDGLETDCHMVKGVQSYEIFTFGIEQHGMNIKDPLKNVSLNLVYSAHDDSQKDMILEINVGGPEWIKVADLEGSNEKDSNEKDTDKEDIDKKDIDKKDTDKKDSNEKGSNEKKTYQEIIPITDKVNTVAKINNLKVRFSAIGNSNSGNKDVWIDFIGIHVGP